ncbi:tRNA (N(6)-L-threonylcarbamoyladenosine(37)-C(2))-methylthiotransferase MtaB [Neolewinella litorea]|uniref:Threonylcarbamoyladenosine tRNA methylthiotransferase MtaB n=1 Tax=Neolewinella litorea TaxID=2562452 RepID=A0A4S4NFS2_9BACT|nr:tRNA (N(6)-L-threonylcarbamoyladenosine(37)-C(2))-methylthiotransferase MtaB [Neolewinella litorea]THH34920.1 tRNA (N(6)-L-threonylcarbamoyladenosine(37)-C(2))-methylthiotransferase MtaB [Neolewinella litorea]
MSTIGTVSFYTLGCKLNYSETSAIGRQFEGVGYREVPFAEGADVVVINTCSVTEFADRKCRNVVRRALKKNPDAKVVVVGCYAQLKPEEIANIEGVDLVLGAAEKFRILDFIDGIGMGSGKGMVRAGEVKEADSFVSSFSFGDRTRSFLKVQDGCDYKCTFCTIPLARGASRSSTVEQIVGDAEAIAARGVKEIVLTGVNIGDFGNGTQVIEGTRPRKEALFVDLARALDEVEGINRFRISSIEPNLCTDEVIDFVANSKRFAPHFHMPLQSGNNKQLAQMRRRYRRELFAERVAHIRSVMPHCCIGVDLIVGFPGETEEDFLETYRFVQELDVTYLHVFTYSERANTPAAEMDGAVPLAERRRRNRMLQILSDKKRRAFYERHLGQTRPVLLEKGKEEGLLQGFTDNYIKVSFAADDSWINHLVDLELDPAAPPDGSGTEMILPGRLLVES